MKYGVCTNQPSLCRRAGARELMPMPGPDTRCSEPGCGKPLLPAPGGGTATRHKPSMSVIAVAVALLVGGTSGYFLFQQSHEKPAVDQGDKSDGPISGTTTPQQPSTDTTPKKLLPDNKPTPQPTDKDSNASNYFAGIDLGSRGVKAYIYSFVRDGEGIDERVIFKNDINTKLVSSAIGKRFNPEGIEEAKRAVVKLVGEMRTDAEQKAIAPRFYLVASSEVSAFENRDDLKSAVDAATGMELEFIDVRTEALGAFLSAVPSTRRQEGIIVDIGSGNTKLGCMTGDVFNHVEIPYGTVTLRKSVPTDREYFLGLQEAVSTVAAAYRVERMNTPCLGNRTRIYLIGGTPWATATFSRPEAALSSHVPLVRRDIDAFLQRLQSGKWDQDEPRFIFEPQVSAARQEATKTANLSDRKAIPDKFSREDLLAGVSLMRTILDNANPSAHLWFVRNKNYLFGYALDKFNDIKIGDDMAEAHSTR